MLLLYPFCSVKEIEEQTHDADLKMYDLRTHLLKLPHVRQPDLLRVLQQLQPTWTGRTDPRNDSSAARAAGTDVRRPGRVSHQPRLVADFEVRIRAKGMAGAIWMGVRTARRENLRKRTHVRQARITAVAA